MAFVLAVVSVLLAGAGYLLGSRRGRSHEEKLKADLVELNEKLVLVEGDLLRRSSLDIVTRLHTQEHFQQRLEGEWRRASRERHYVSVIMVEIDHFAAFVARQGQQDGDACLKAIAGALKPLIHRPATSSRTTAVRESSAWYWGNRRERRDGAGPAAPARGGGSEHA